LDVIEIVLHDVAGVALLDADLDRITVAVGAGAAERQQAMAKPLLEISLLSVLELSGLHELDDHALAETLMPGFLVDDLADDIPIGQERAAIVFLELPETATVEEELRHRELEPRIHSIHRLAGQARHRDRR